MTATDDRAGLFPPATYDLRRQALATVPGRGLAIFPGALESAMNFAANPYPFVQDASFRYFFGLDEPGLIGIVDLDGGHATLFGEEDDADHVLWHGSRPGLTDRAAAAGVGRVAPSASAREMVARAQSAGRSLHYLPPYRPDASLLLSRLLDRDIAAIPAGVSLDLIRAVVSLREIKSAEEVVELEAALEVTHAMHLAAMRGSRAGRFEYQVVGEMEGLARGADRMLAYPIIFSRQGEVLHNFAHSHRLAAGDLVINDSGATSPRGYASDITRTIPVGGRFDPRQREIYDIVLRAQEAAIAALRPGLPYVDAHRIAATVIADGMVGLGLFRGDPVDLVAAGVHAIVFPHGLGHPIGLDVHDMEALGEEHVGYDGAPRSRQFGLNHLRMSKPLKAGMTMTVEPGLYFIAPLIRQWQAEHRFADSIDYGRLETWLGFGGVRIEDDVLITASGSHILGPEIPKQVEAVEAAVGG